ncbi:FkbM family methyltransferase [Erythrobacter litoralis]|uniref:Methyltransferase, FkbM family protein n=1 Tax=Erythrobacter litoralis (strain HTCC2594) TaxID=314225 RepID=Q2N9A9_ERYLH|nr:FkbM family methyltransferase [Erythrobacter litoralis]ABC63732.1 methyltransferase, FkbM family protein [Erythrobacter litoralis HTCC2594]
MSFLSRLTSYASLGLIGAGKGLAGNRYGDGWNGLAAIPAKTVLDIGACGGELAERELLGAFPQARLHCFEPHPASFARLERVAARHPRIHAHHIALGDSEMMVDMQFNPGSPSSSSLRMQTAENVTLFPQVADTITTPVSQRRLDDWAREQGDALEGPLVVKMDVQGFEDRVIAGGQETLRRADGIVLEVCLAPLYEGQPTFAALHDSLASLGFAFAGTRDQFFGEGGKVIYLDAVFLREGG